VTRRKDRGWKGSKHNWQAWHWSGDNTHQRHAAERIDENTYKSFRQTLHYNDLIGKINLGSIACQF